MMMSTDLTATTQFIRFDITDLYKMIPSDRALDALGRFCAKHAKQNKIGHLTRYVTVPFQLSELEVFEQFSFI